jgi:hypothetical protein
MFLQLTKNSERVEVLDTAELFDPFKDSISGRLHRGEELQDPDRFSKADLSFPSGEALPRCWMDPHYRA